MSGICPMCGGPDFEHARPPMELEEIIDAARKVTDSIYATIDEMRETVADFPARGHDDDPIACECGPLQVPGPLGECALCLRLIVTRGGDDDRRRLRSVPDPSQ